MRRRKLKKHGVVKNKKQHVRRSWTGFDNENEARGAAEVMDDEGLVAVTLIAFVQDRQDHRLLDDADLQIELAIVALR